MNVCAQKLITEFLTLSLYPAIFLYFGGLGSSRMLSKCFLSDGTFSALTGDPESKWK